MNILLKNMFYIVIIVLAVFSEITFASEEKAFCGDVVPTALVPSSNQGLVAELTNVVMEKVNLQFVQMQQENSTLKSDVTGLQTALAKLATSTDDIFQIVKKCRADIAQLTTRVTPDAVLMQSNKNVIETLQQQLNSMRTTATAAPKQNSNQQQKYRDYCPIGLKLFVLFPAILSGAYLRDGSAGILPAAILTALADQILPLIIRNLAIPTGGQAVTALLSGSVLMYVLTFQSATTCVLIGLPVAGMLVGMIWP